ncbi:hypothetical protein [Cryobacterium sp. PH31-L1]|uniref:hypothetical protein n=1 Tax=Cryobacterium sp. PH31-L1 TaxID=3046199 RepID=UPI0024B8C8D1|nr:hypothetical protein [Cryobacterium sp. PH31-L1]MDJ0375928.1 hypothetical protein [Cryobacterium sp. PH31-L1]
MCLFSAPYLDRQIVDQLVDALLAQRGALGVVSHDDAGLARMHLTTTLTLDTAGALAEGVKP